MRTRSQPVTILIRMPNWLGDCVMAMPAVQHLAEALPKARIYVAARKVYRDLLAAQPGVAGFVEAPESGFGALCRGVVRARRGVREAGLADGVDIGLLLTNSFSSAVWMRATGAAMRIGYNTDGRRPLLSHALPCGGVERSWHFIRYYMWLAKFTESVVSESAVISRRETRPLGEYLTPTLEVEAAAREAAAVLTREAGVVGAYAVIAPASAYGSVKDWPVQHYRALVETLNRDFSMPVIITGGADQAAVAAAVADGLPGAYNVAGKTDMRSFAGLLAGAGLFVGGDSGGAHLAAALGTPTVVIFGITNPTRTCPTGLRVATIGSGEDKDVKLDTPAAREAAKMALEAIRPEQVAEVARGLVNRAAEMCGKGNGKVWMADDFDAPLNDFAEYM